MKKFLTLLLFVSCSALTALYSQTGYQTKKAMVVSAREEASKIGVQIMKDGGNAFDAMVATELALAVAYPYAGNLGGGGFMVYRKNDGETGTLDYREKAPAAAHKDMYLDDKKEVVPGLSTEGAMSIGVPGTIAGIFEAHRKHGRLPIDKIMKPVIALAKKGVVVTEKQLAQMNQHREAISRVSGEKSLLAMQYKVGDVIKYPALAETLERIMKNGPDEFYKGRTAQVLTTFLKSKGGLITMDDMAAYKAVWRTPVVFHYKDLRVISMGPPSSGGVALAQILLMIEPHNVGELGYGSLQSVQVITEAERRAYVDRSHYLGDPDFTKVPVIPLTRKNYLRKRMSSFDKNKATPSSDMGPGKVAVVESNETTHYSIVDPEGNAVSVTTTLNGAFGSKLYSDDLGFFLNNEMDDFSIKPGTPNSYGLTGSEANSIAPGKRMLSSMTPTIVEKDRKLYMVLGSPGGSTIITSVLQTLLNVYEHKMTMQQAVDAPRYHHQWLPDVIYAERGCFTAEGISELKERGYEVSEQAMPVIGKVDAILVRPDGSYEAGADPRGDDKAAGF